MVGENLEGVLNEAQDGEGQEPGQGEPQGLTPEAIQKLTELKKTVDAEIERVKKETEARLQSVKDREVGKVIREKRDIDADLKATQAGLGFIVESIAKGMEPGEFQGFQAGLAQRVSQARAQAVQLPPEEEDKVIEAQLKVVELRKAGIAVDFRNPKTSDPRLDFTFPSTFIASADAVLAGLQKPPASTPPQEPPKPPVAQVQPPDIDEAGRISSNRRESKEKIDEQYAIGVIGRAEYAKKLQAIGFNP